jgi:hypothetical protein
MQLSQGTSRAAEYLREIFQSCKTLGRSGTPVEPDGRTTMFEYDEDGKEWFGYSFSSEESDHTAVVSVFLGNVQYLEWFFRHIKNAPKKLTLARQLDYLFDLLPDGAERAITDDRVSLIRAIVRVRNRYAHGKFEEAAASIKRVHTLSVKVAALLSFAERAHEGFPNEVIEMAKRGSPYLRGKLGQTDVPQ